jgi:hypothetical protein
MTAEIDLMNEKLMYVVKCGRLIAHELPDYDQTIVVTMGGQVIGWRRHRNGKFNKQ